MKISVIIILLLSADLFAADDLGLEHYNNKNFDMARQYYEEILENNRENSPAHFGRGVSAFEQGDFLTAMEAFDQALKTDDKELKSKAYYNMGNALFQQQKTEESLAFYKKALELNPHDTDAKYNYEYLKYFQEQQQSDQQQDQSEDQDKQDDQSNQDNQSDDQKDQENSQNQEAGDQEKEPEKSNENDEEKNETGENEDEPESEENSNPNPVEEDQKEENQDLQNAKAILDALKEDEKINKKRQLQKMSSRKMEKDW